MNQELIHVYFIPGMAANPTIFEHINLPESTFKIHHLEWFLPEHIDEHLSSYAQRMVGQIEHENCVLIGVSFGGILVQEMRKFIPTKKVIIISSVSSWHELPKRLKLLRATKFYKALPTQLASNIDLLAKFSMGVIDAKRIELYKKYLSVSDKLYLDWAIKQTVNWNQEQAQEDVIHIHGDKDGVFPIKNIKNSIVVKGGTHVMILNKFKWFNENLPTLILG